MCDCNCVKQRLGFGVQADRETNRWEKSKRISETKHRERERERESRIGIGGEADGDVENSKKRDKEREKRGRRGRERRETRGLGRWKRTEWWWLDSIEGGWEGEKEGERERVEGWRTQTD